MSAQTLVKERIFEDFLSAKHLSTIQEPADEYTIPHSSYVLKKCVRFPFEPRTNVTSHTISQDSICTVLIREQPFLGKFLNDFYSS